MEEQIQENQEQNYPGFEEYDQGNIKQRVEVNFKETVTKAGVTTTQYYQVIYFKNEQKYRDVTRRYSDFEWLFNQLNYMYYGHIIPPIPPKDTYVKFSMFSQSENPKDKSQEFINFRISIFKIFLDILLQDKDLQNSKDLNVFLTEESNSIFENHKNQSEYTENYNKQDYKISKVAKNIFTGIKNFTGQNQQLRGNRQNFEMIQTQEEELKFRELKSHYDVQKQKLDSVYNCFKHIFEYKETQYTNLQEVSEIFDELDKINDNNQMESIKNSDDELDSEKKQNDEDDFNKIEQNDQKKLPNLIKDASLLQQNNYQQLLQEVLWPLNGYLIYIQNCLDLLTERDTLIQEIQDLEESLKQQDDQSYEIKHQESKQRLKTFGINFLANKDNFDTCINNNVQSLIMQLSKNQESFSKQMLEIWDKEVKYK